MKYLIANFKANLNHLDIINWLEIFVPETQKNTQIQQKLQAGEIKVVVCPPFSFLLPIRKKKKIDADTPIVCYEPPQSIGTGDNLSLDETLKTKKQLPLTPKQLFFYGGSVNAHDIHQYQANPEIAGFLIGTASVSPTDFLALLSAV